MKLYKLILSIVCVLMLTGCSALNGNSIMPVKYPQTMNGWSFQYNEGTNDYSLFFALLDEDENPMATEVNVDIRIVTDMDETLYEGTKEVKETDFGNYSSPANGDRYLANVRIPYADLEKGSAQSGTVYFTVYHDDTISFEEASCQALYCLPIKDVEVVAEGLPAEIDVKDYKGDVESTIRIDEVTYDFESDYSLRLTIVVKGEKIYGTGDSLYDMLSYKIYDSEGYVVESSNLYIDSIDQGDKFKDDSIVMYDVTPGEKYTIKFSEYEL